MLLLPCLGATPSIPALQVGMLEGRLTRQLIISLLNCNQWFCLALPRLLCPSLSPAQVGMLEGRLTRQLIISLLNHIRAFSDWAQCFVLELVATYQPASEEERFDILEVR